MVLIYFAQVCFGWLPFTENKVEDVANYIKGGYLQMWRENASNWLHSILGRFSSDFRKLKILSKHLLPQYRVREFLQEQASYSIGTMHAWFPMGEPIREHGSCPLNLTRHWLFWVGAGPHFPRIEQFPTGSERQRKNSRKNLAPKFSLCFKAKVTQSEWN